MIKCSPCSHMMMMMKISTSTTFQTMGSKSLLDFDWTNFFLNAPRRFYGCLPTQREWEGEALERPKGVKEATLTTMNHIFPKYNVWMKKGLGIYLRNSKDAVLRYLFILFW